MIRICKAALKATWTALVCSPQMMALVPLLKREPEEEAAPLSTLVVAGTGTVWELGSAASESS